MFYVTAKAQNTAGSITGGHGSKTNATKAGSATGGTKKSLPKGQKLGK